MTRSEALEPPAEIASAPDDPLALPPAGADEDLGALLATRPGRGRMPRSTVALCAAVLLVGGFLGGVLTQRHVHPAATSAAADRAAAFAGRFGAGATGTGGSAGGAAGRAGAGFDVGTVRLVDGRTLYVEMADGNYVKVRTTASTRVLVTKSASVSALSPGTTVVVVGRPGPGGTVTATSVAQGGLGGFAGRSAGGSGSGGG